MKIIRWSAVIPITIIIVLIVVFNIFFLDKILKKAFISAGEGIFGAKTEISDVKTTLKNISIGINGLQIADKEMPMKNIAQIKEIKFGLLTIPLLSKKVIIDEMKIEAIEWGTQRTTSGVLPPKKLKKIEKAKAKEDKESFTSKLMGNLKKKASDEASNLPALKNMNSLGDNLKNIKFDTAISSLNIQSIQEIEKMSAETKEKYNKYTKQIKEFKIDEQVNLVKVSLDEAKDIKIQKMEDIPTAQNKIAKLNSAKQSIDTTLNTAKTLQANITSDLSNEKELLNKINSLKDQDYKNALSKLNVGQLSTQNIAQAIFGPVWINKVSTALNYIHLARKYMAGRKKDQKKTEQQRMKGTDIAFHKDTELPGLLIKKINITGDTGGPGKEGDIITFHGTATDITSDPVLYGKPAKIEIVSDTSQAGKKDRSYEVICLFDHTKDIPDDTITMTMKNLPIKQYSFGSTEYLPVVETGKLDVVAKFNLKGEILDATMELKAYDLVFAIDKTKKDPGGGDLISYIFKDLKTVTLNAKLYGEMDKLSMTCDSNLDDLISNRIKSLYGEKLNELRAKVKAEVDKLVEGKKQELLNDFTSKKTELQGMATSKVNEIQSQANAINDKKKAVEKQIEDYKDQQKKKLDEEKRKLDEEKKKAEDQLKNKASDKLKGLFNK